MARKSSATKSRTKKTPEKKEHVHFTVTPEQYAIIQEAQGHSITSAAMWQREAVMAEANRLIREHKKKQAAHSR